MGDDISNSVFNFGDLSKPATVLIEKISEAIGGIARPNQMRRIAKAEVDAELIKTEGRIKITELGGRALARMVYEEGLKQENIENITAKAIPNLSRDSKPENIEKDWLTYFFNRCRLTSDEEMQSLWAGILAGEANAPGSFSKRSVELVASLDKRDAELFTKFCAFCWTIGNLTPLILNEHGSIYNSLDIHFHTLTHLDNIGLITFDYVGFNRPKLSKCIPVSYYGRATMIEFAQDENTLQIGKVLLTQTGNELARICGSKPSEEYYSYVIEEWYNRGYVLSSILNQKAA